MKILVVTGLFFISLNVWAMDSVEVLGKYRGVSPQSGQKCVLSIHEVELGSVLVQMRESTDLLIPKVISESFELIKFEEQLNLALDRGYLYLRKDTGTPSREAFVRFEIKISKEGKLQSVQGFKYKNLNYTTKSKSLDCINLKKVTI